MIHILYFVRFTGMLDAAPGHSVGPAGGIVTEVHVLPASINGRPAKIKGRGY